MAYTADTRLLDLTVKDLRELLGPISNLNQKQHKPEPEYDGLTPPQAKEYLTANGFPVKSVNVLYMLVYKREIPFAKRGKRLIFSRKELAEWLMENRVPTASERLEETESYISEHKKTARL